MDELFILTKEIDSPSINDKFYNEDLVSVEEIIKMADDLYDELQRIKNKEEDEVEDMYEDFKLGLLD